MANHADPGERPQLSSAAAPLDRDRTHQRLNRAVALLVNYERAITTQLHVSARYKAALNRTEMGRLETDVLAAARTVSCRERAELRAAIHEEVRALKGRALAPERIVVVMKSVMKDAFLETGVFEAGEFLRQESFTWMLEEIFAA